MDRIADELDLLLQVRAACADGTAKQTRLTAGLSLRDLSDRVDVPASTLASWENQQHKPYGDAAVRYAAALKHLAAR